MWWRMPLIPTLRRQRQVNLCEFESSLVYIDSSRIARAIYIYIERDPVSKFQNKCIYSKCI